MAFEAFLGNDTGSITILADNQIDGSLFTTPYVQFVTEWSNAPLAGAVESTGKQVGIFPNGPEYRDFFMKQIQKWVNRVGDTTFEFKKQFYYNASLTQGQVLEILKANGSLETYLAAPETVQLDPVGVPSDLEFLQALL